METKQFIEQLLEKYVENRSIKAYVDMKTVGFSEYDREEILQKTYIKLTKNLKYLEKNKDKWQDEVWLKRYGRSMAWYEIKRYWTEYYRKDNSKKQVETIPWPQTTGEDGDIMDIDFPDDSRAEDLAIDRGCYEFFEMCLRIYMEQYVPTHNSRVSCEDQCEMLRMRIQNYSYQEIADRFHVSPQAVQHTTIKLAEETSDIAEKIIQRSLTLKKAPG